MKALSYALFAVLFAIFVSSTYPASAMQQSQEMAAKAKHHKVLKHLKQGACRQGYDRHWRC